MEESQLLAHQDLILEFCGKSFSFSDEQAQRSWTVNPFGWMLNVDESKIQIDWEHSGWKWFDPQKVLDGSMADQCVPNIHKSLQRVYFGPEGIFKNSDLLITRSNSAGMAFLQTIQGLKTNTKDGARVLATEALKGLCRVVECFQTSPNQGQQSSKYWHALRAAAYYLIYSGRPSMNAAISAAVLDALNVIAEHIQVDQLNLQVACDVLEDCIAKRTSTSTKIAEAFSTFTTKNMIRFEAEPRADQKNPDSSQRVLNIITISSSSTILAALKQIIKDQNNRSAINLTILESRPACEGATLAASLITSIKESHPKPRLNIKIAPESHISLLTRHHKALVLLGADRITSTGHVINKTGSAQLALVARARGCKVAVLSEADKIAKPQPELLETYKRYIEREDNESLSEDDRREMTECVRKEFDDGHVERHDAKEVYSAWPGEARETLLKYIDGENGDGGTMNTGLRVGVKNIYFETVDEAHIDHYVSEDGEVSRDQILRRSVERARLEDELFGDLYE